MHLQAPDNKLMFLHWSIAKLSAQHRYEKLQADAAQLMPDEAQSELESACSLVREAHAEERTKPMSRLPTASKEVCQPRTCHAM